MVKPGGRIILVNHLYSECGVAAAVERWAAKRTRKLGLRPRRTLHRAEIACGITMSEPSEVAKRPAAQIASRRAREMWQVAPILLQRKTA